MGIPDPGSMFKTRIEIQIALVALVIITAVTTAGFLVYESMSRIVQSVYHEARPDNRLFLMKDISNELVSLENNVRLYILSDHKGASLPTDTLRHIVEGKLGDGSPSFRKRRGSTAHRLPLPARTPEVRAVGGGFFPSPEGRTGRTHVFQSLFQTGRAKNRYHYHCR